MATFTPALVEDFVALLAQVSGCERFALPAYIPLGRSRRSSSKSAFSFGERWVGI